MPAFPDSENEREMNELDEARAVSNALFEILPDGILLLDVHNRILRANAPAAALLGAPPDSLSGLSLFRLMDQDSLIELVAHIRTTGRLQATELYMPSIHGPCQISGTLLHGGPGSSAHPLLLLIRDITPLRRLESAGEEYATNVSHELKTPLTLILGYTETLLTHGTEDGAFLKKSLRTIERHTKRILRIIDDLLRLAWLRNESHTVGIARSTVSLPDLIEDTISHCGEWATKAGIAIEPHVPPHLLWHLNGGLIEEALVNLVKNAILYALVGPIEIRVRVLENGYLQIAVADRGPGLKPEDAKRIFDRFYRADKSRARASGGSGLGLPIVQQIVEAHQGTARVETSPGKGCTFLLEIPPGPSEELSLPITKTAGARASCPPENGPHRKSGGQDARAPA